MHYAVVGKQLCLYHFNIFGNNYLCLSHVLPERRTKKAPYLSSRRVYVCLMAIPISHAC